MVEMQEKVSFDDSVMKVTFVSVDADRNREPTAPEPDKSFWECFVVKQGFWFAFLAILQAVLSVSFLVFWRTWLDLHGSC